jgi:uncharacterized protein YjdB
MKKKISTSLALLLVMVLATGLLPAEALAADSPSISYRTHVQNDGWQNFVTDGTMSGTSGRSLRLEGIEVKLDTKGYDLGITYQTHIQNIGWEGDTGRGWKADGIMSGTEGMSYRLEAIQIKLTGNDASGFDVYYQVHAQNMGWLGWAKNGESAGTAGYAYRLEGIRIVIVKKGESPPANNVDRDLPFYEPEYISGNLFVDTTVSDFDNRWASSSNVDPANGTGDGAMVLTAGAQQGIYTSNIFNAPAFNKLVMSWNCDTPTGTTISVEARVGRIYDLNGQLMEQWSNWLSWGTWGTTISRASGTGLTDDPFASVDVDTLLVKGGQTANKLQYRVILNSNTSGVTPTVKLVAGALRNTLPGQGITKVFSGNPDLSNLPTLAVPQLSQMVRDPAIADSICSPTSVTMVLNYYGTNLQPETAAWGAYDYSYEDFGNWPFNTAYAGSLGYSAYVDYSTVEGLKREIAAGHPVVTSVAYKNSAKVNANLPVIDGAPIASTFGHLIVVCGFINQNGVDYVVINDPAAASNSGVRVKYRLDQFAAAWAESGNIAYIIHQ